MRGYINAIAIALGVSAFTATALAGEASPNKTTNAIAAADAKLQSEIDALMVVVADVIMHACFERINAAGLYKMEIHGLARSTAK